MRNPQDAAQQQGQPALITRAMRFHLSGVISSVEKDWSVLMRFFPRQDGDDEAIELDNQWGEIAKIYHPFYYAYRHEGNQLPMSRSSILHHSRGLAELLSRMFGHNRAIAAVSLTQHIRWIEEVIKRVSASMNHGQGLIVPQNIHPNPP